MSFFYAQMCNYQLTQSSLCPSNRIQTSLALCQKVPPSFPVCVVICCEEEKEGGERVEEKEGLCLKTGMQISGHMVHKAG